jgi:hypothetical protein
LSPLAVVDGNTVELNNHSFVSGAPYLLPDQLNLLLPQLMICPEYAGVLYRGQEEFDDPANKMRHDGSTASLLRFKVCLVGE